MQKKKAPRNRTIELSTDEVTKYSSRLIRTKSLTENIQPDTIINGDLFEAAKYIPENSVDLLFLDPPYNLGRNFKSNVFNRTTEEKYTAWFDSWFKLLLPSLKETASVYVCGDWKTSISIYQVIKNHLTVRNRITWEREKGRGAKTNFKNSHEDIWFATKSNDYTFNLDAIKMKRKVIAPYRENGKPKDWNESAEGNYRLTHPGNFWNDISIPFWSMPENTEHPTQKPEKLVAKLILASTNEQDVVFDPFLGSGTTAVVAKKLNRKYFGVELTEEYVMLAYKRLENAVKDKSIQGYHNGVFWERNSLAEQNKKEKDGESELKFEF